MESGEPFSIEFVTCDMKRKKGGEIISIDGAVLRRTAVDREQEKQSNPINANPSRSANEYTNATRNLLLPNGQTRKIHIRLITMFNGQSVTY